MGGVRAVFGVRCVVVVLGAGLVSEDLVCLPGGRAQALLRRERDPAVPLSIDMS